MESPSLEIFQTGLDAVLCSLLWVTLLRQGVGLGDSQRALPTPTVLWFPRGAEHHIFSKILKFSSTFLNESGKIKDSGEFLWLKQARGVGAKTTKSHCGPCAPGTQAGCSPPGWRSAAELPERFLEVAAGKGGCSRCSFHEPQQLLCRWSGVCRTAGNAVKEFGASWAGFTRPTSGYAAHERISRFTPRCSACLFFCLSKPPGSFCFRVAVPPSHKALNSTSTTWKLTAMQCSALLNTTKNYRES